MLEIWILVNSKIKWNEDTGWEENNEINEITIDKITSFLKQYREKNSRTIVSINKVF